MEAAGEKGQAQLVIDVCVRLRLYVAQDWHDRGSAILAGRTQPKLIIDYATLTGASVYALTERMSSVIEEATNRLVKAGREEQVRLVGFSAPSAFSGEVKSGLS